MVTTWVTIWQLGRVEVRQSGRNESWRSDETSGEMGAAAEDQGSGFQTTETKAGVDVLGGGAKKD